MNILIPHKWLLEHLDTKATPKQIQEYLSLCGPSIEKIDIVNGESVYDIEVTTNRVDMISVRGIAREASVILPEFGIDAKLKKMNVSPSNSKKSLGIEIENDSNLCNRILAVKLENINIKPSPKNIQDKLNQVGLRPLNNAIDITNYVMWELGHPIHVFDYDRLTEKKIVVRPAKKGEKLITLDDKTHVLKGGEVVFDDGTGIIIDLPGIMGTKNTVVTDKTKNILLWIESVDAVKIRSASMGLAIRSQAAILNEKHVDPYLADQALNKAIHLYESLTNAKVTSKIIDIFPNKPKEKIVKLPKQKLFDYLGIEIGNKKVERILTNLGFENISFDGQSYSITVPSFRTKDITIYQDIIEEIARIYGYHKLPSVVMDTPIPDHPPKEDFNFEYKIKTLLSGWGANEIYTYSMVSERLTEQSTFETNKHLKIKNPLTDDLVYMRRSLIPSLIQVIRENQQENITIFEMQNVYHPNKASQLPTEELQLVIATNQDYRHLKGIVDLLLDKLHIDNPTFQPKPINSEPLDPQSSGEIKTNKTKIGVIGKVKNQSIFIAKFIMPILQEKSSPHPKYIPIINTPPIIEDLTFTLKSKTVIGHLMKDIEKVSPLIRSIDLKDVYQQNFTFTISYRHKSKPLSDKEVAPIRKKIVQSLYKNHSAQLVGNLD